MTRLMTVLTVLVSVFMACLFLMFFATAALANATCFPRDRLVSFLAEKHGEYLQSAGLTEGGQLLEVFVSSSGTFTVISTAPRSELSCALIVGRGWEEYEAHELEGDPS